MSKIRAVLIESKGLFVNKICGILIDNFLTIQLFVNVKIIIIVSYLQWCATINEWKKQSGEIS